MPILAATEELYNTYASEVAGWLHAMSTPDTSAGDIVSFLQQDRYQLYFTFSGERLIGIVITHVNDKALQFVGASGDVLGEWDVLHEQFVQLAKEKELTSIEFRGRRGFLRTFKKYGMVEKMTIMEMKI